MSRMHPPHNEVELEQSSAGVWTTSRVRRWGCKPWQRLWAVVGMVYLILIAGSYYLLLPNQESIERQMVFAVTEEVRRYDGMAFAGESPRKVFEAARGVGYAEWIAALRTKYRIGREGDAGFERIERRYRDEVSRLPAEWALGVVVCIVVWLVPMALLYGFGAIVDWIRRGVRVQVRR